MNRGNNLDFVYMKNPTQVEAFCWSEIGVANWPIWAKNLIQERKLGIHVRGARLGAEDADNSLVYVTVNNGDSTFTAQMEDYIVMEEDGRMYAVGKDLFCKMYVYTPQPLLKDEVMHT